MKVWNYRVVLERQNKITYNEGDVVWLSEDRFSPVILDLIVYHRLTLFSKLTFRDFVSYYYLIFGYSLKKLLLLVSISFGLTFPMLCVKELIFYV